MPIDRDSATRLSGYYVAISDNEGWSLYGAPWLQPVAISGKSERRGSRGNKPEPLPWVATSCLRCSMVRRGSTVRVRQRVCKSAANRRLVLSAPLARSPPCVRYGALYGAFRFRSPGPRRRKPSRLRGLGTTAGRVSSRHASRCRDTAGRCESGSGRHGRSVGQRRVDVSSRRCIRCEAAGCARRSGSSAFRAAGSGS
jgi:hypothetical protein